MNLIADLVYCVNDYSYGRENTITPGNSYSPQIQVVLNYDDNEVAKPQLHLFIFEFSQRDICANIHNYYH